MSSWQWLPSLSFLIFLVNIASLVKSQFPTPIFIHYKCQDTYPSNSQYESNLDTLLGSISANISSTGFYNASLGVNLDRVNVIALCRADLQPFQCSNYTEEAISKIKDLCRGQKQAVLWHEFCMVRYSDEPIFGALALTPNENGKSGENVSDPDVFYPELNVLLDSVRQHAAFNSSPKKFSGSTRNVPNYRTIYAFEQCTPDITPEECNDCLTNSSRQIRDCCYGARGVRILRPSCYLRFETDPFYNASMVDGNIFQPPTPPAPPRPPPPSPGKGNNKTRTIIIIVVPIIACLGIALSIFIYLKTKRSRTTRESVEFDSGISTIESLQYDFGTIRDATNNFFDANKLGHGGFGVVYRGKLPRGNEIAVKRLSRGLGQGDQEFKNEVLLVARLQHRNLARLLGFSVEGDERLLIYEYVENGSLDGFIFDLKRHPPMDWGKRYNIIGGIAKGLLYLHEDSRLRIIHRDLKASNVLLDGEMNPKISDFGMARLFDVPNETQHSTSRIVGTYGYMAPEYILHGQFSIKSDVYSYGVLILEIVSGKRVSEFGKEESTEDLLSCVWKNWHQGTVAEIIDPALRTSSGHFQNIMQCIHIGLLCVQENPIDRPTMGSVVLMLSSFSLTLAVPSKPAFFMSRSFYVENQRNISSNDQSDNTTNLSNNEVTMSELDPR